MRSSKGRLTDRDRARFPDDTLFHRIARTVCQAGALPRKELYEAWEVARRTRRLFRGGRIVDLGAGHGLLAQLLLILDDSSPRALAVDTVIPPSSARLHEVLIQEWPRLAGRVAFEQRSLQDVSLDAGDLVVSSHACGSLTDLVIERAVAAGARLAVLPCCHDLRHNDIGPLSGWVDPPLAIDIMRTMRLSQHGYRVWTQTIPAAITPKNRLLIAAPTARRISTMANEAPTPVHVPAGSKGAFAMERDGQRLATLTYTLDGDTGMTIDRTDVDAALRGTGAGGTLVEAAVTWARTAGRKINPVCTFAKAQFDKTPAYSDVLA